MQVPVELPQVVRVPVRVIARLRVLGADVYVFQYSFSYDGCVEGAATFLELSSWGVVRVPVLLRGLVLSHHQHHHHHHAWY